MAAEKPTASTSTPEVSPLPEAFAEDLSNTPPDASSPMLTDSRAILETPPSPETASQASETSGELNESVEQLDASSLEHLQTTERKSDHRRNKSDPVKSPSMEDLLNVPGAESSPTSGSKNGLSGYVRRKANPLTTSTRKKKPWYNPFQSTYRQRNEEFQRLFKDVPDNERLIVDYSCAWQKDILVQGRMYLSANYLCFYANILNWKSHLCLKLDEIAGITREKTAKVISNAIELKTNKGDRFFFASFVTRDKTYAIMHRLWQAVSDNQPISVQQTWALIHESYGDDLGMTTDEDDTHSRSSRNSHPSKQSTKASPQSLDKYDRLTPSSIVTNSFPGEDDQSSLSSRGEHPSDEEGTSPIGDDARTNTLMHRARSAAGEHESSPTTSSSLLARPDIPYLTQCPCDSHLATELINQTYPMSVERLYDCIFGDNDFLIAYRASRRIKDYQAGEWKLNEETGKRERMLNYKVTVSTVFSSTTICSNERQIIDCEQPMSHYILDTEVRNEGIKYADAFFVASRYCLVQTGPHRSHLKLTCEVKYVKSLMAIIKSFIEKNAMAALQDSFTDLMKRIEQESSKRSRAHSVNNNNNQESGEAVQPSPTTTRRLSCQPNEQQTLDDSVPSVEDLLVDSRNEPTSTQEFRSKPTPVVSSAFHSSRINYFIPFSFATMLLLLILNIFLWIKLNQIDRMTDRLIRSQPSWLHQYSSRPEENQWTSLLKTQEEFYQMQLDSLHSVLLSTHQALRNVTDTLKQLSTR